MEFFQDDLQKQVQRLVDNYTPEAVLWALRDICNIKAEHIESNLGDRPLARKWRIGGELLSGVINQWFQSTHPNGARRVN